MEHSIYEVNDRVLITEGELVGCMGTVTTIGPEGLLVVKPDQPELHASILISDASVHLQEMAKPRK